MPERAAQVCPTWKRADRVLMSKWSGPCHDNILPVFCPTCQRDRGSECRRSIMGFASALPVLRHWTE
jgi:hypothetical protein